MGVSESQSAIGRLPTGVPGLDTILQGGLLRGSLNLILGGPGTGKTILGSQIAFHHVAAGERAVFMTLLGESHGRMLAHLRSLRFFDPAVIPAALYLVSGYEELEKGGPDGLAAMIRRLIREHRATLFVLDGLSLLALLAGSALATHRFFHELHTFSGVSGCTTLLLDLQEGGAPRPESALADAVISLASTPVGHRAARALVVSKLRGSDFLSGQHLFTLTAAGLTVYPRTEARLAAEPPDASVAREKLSLGSDRLDGMLRGGVLRGSSTALIGAPGSGKTVLGLSALAAGGRAGEPGLYLGFREPPAQILAKGERLGLGLEALCRRGLLELAWRPPFEGNLDELVAWLLEAVARRGCRRLFLDSLDGLRQLALFPERLPSVFAALAAELRRCGVTLLCSEEAPLFRSELELPLQGLSGLAENILLLRYLERGARMHRLLSILKVRDDEYDSTMREFEITAQGLVVAETSASAEALLADTPSRTVAGPGTPQGPGP